MSEQLLDKPLPHTPEAEKAILGLIMLDNRLMDEAAIAIKRPEWFYIHSCRLVYSAMCELHESEKVIDHINISDVLRSRGKLESIGGLTFLMNLTYGLPLMSKLKPYTDLLHRKYKYRWMIDQCRRITEDAINEEDDPDTLIREVTDQFSDMKDESSVVSEHGGLIRDSVPVLENYLYLVQAGVNPAIPTGINAFDELTGGGITPGEMWGIGAMSSAGKTSLLLQWLTRMARSGIACVLFSLEMTFVKLLIRVLASYTGVAFNKIKYSSKPSEIDYLLTHAFKALDMPLYVYSDCHSIADFKAKLRVLERKVKIQVVGIDYYGKILGRERHENRTQELKYIADALQKWAIQTDLGVIVPTQFNRSAWSVGKNAGPGNIDGGDAYYHSCDMYATLHTEKQKDVTDYKVKGFLEVFKQRNGPTGRVNLTFDRRKMLFEGCIEDEGEVDEPEVTYSNGESLGQQY